MTSKDLYLEFGNIDLDMVEAAAPTQKIKTKKRNAWTKWFSIAACFAIAMIIAIPIINNLKIDNPGEYKAHIFSSYDEFNAVVPDIQVIENLANMNGISVTIYGAFVDTSITDSTKLENYAWFDVEAKRGEELFATVQLKLNDKDSAATYVKNHSLVNETTIDGVQVFYAYNTDMEYWDSVFEIDGDYYNLHSYLTDEQGFVKFLFAILDNKN